MEVSATDLPGVMLVKPRVFADPRGYFLETWHQTRYREHGLPTEFVQDNLSFSRHHVLRGLHFQNPCPQGKLVSALAGEVFDVAVDIRRGSPTYGRWTGVTLSGENHFQLYIPEGFAHGFCVLSERAKVCYKCTAPYRPQNEHCLRWDDPEIGIAWPVAHPLVSEKDRRGERLCELPIEALPVYG